MKLLYYLMLGGVSITMIGTTHNDRVDISIDMLHRWSQTPNRTGTSHLPLSTLIHIVCASKNTHSTSRALIAHLADEIHDLRVWYSYCFYPPKPKFFPNPDPEQDHEAQKIFDRLAEGFVLSKRILGTDFNEQALFKAIYELSKKDCNYIGIERKKVGFPVKTGKGTASRFLKFIDNKLEEKIREELRDGWVFRGAQDEQEALERIRNQT